MQTLNTLVGLQLAALRSKGYTADQIATLTETLNGIFNDIDASLETCEAHVNSGHAPASAEENVIVSIKKNGAAVAPVNKIVDISVPTKLSELTDDQGYAKTAEVEQSIANSGHLKAAVVDALPAAANADGNTIYFLRKNEGESGDQYTEYKLVNGAFERIGEAKADLSGYATQTYVAKASDALIQSIVNTEAASSEAYIGAANLALFWSLIKPLISGADVSDLTSRVRLLELVVFNENIEGNPFYVTFESLDGVSASGVWNVSSAQIEF